jgi:carbamoyltransferase
MKVLGYNGGLYGYPSKFGASHNAAAALIIDGELVAACEEERFTREKHSGDFPSHAIEFCLKEAGVKSAEELDLVAYFYSFPMMYRPEIYTQNAHGLGIPHKVGLQTSLFTMRTVNNVFGYNNELSREDFEHRMRVRLKDRQYTVVPHHYCHQASTFYDSPFGSSLVMTMDAQGESTSNLITRASGTHFETLRDTLLPNSLGYFYTYITTLLGFDWHDEYKVMGLAPYGDRARYRDFFRSIITLGPDGKYDVDQRIITQLLVAQGTQSWDLLFPRRITDALGKRRQPDEPVEQRHMDIAAGLQGALEDTVLHALTHFQKTTGEKNLCMAGGVALNSTMNGRIARTGLFDGVWVHPASHDGGTCVGAAMYGYHNVLKQPRHFQKKTHRYLGPGFTPSDVKSALAEYDSKIEHEKPADLTGYVAQALADGKVVGWYQGRMEWGPRALGNRSILADARRDDMKDIVNHAVKLREGFRPFAPAVLAEKAAEWFDLKGLPDSPYMLFVVPVVEDKRALIPAVTHVDGSARVQTVTPKDNPRFHALISEFHRLTGVPVVMNTSFNVKGEPIVNTPADAIRCFLGTMIDILVVDDVAIVKRPEVTARLRATREAQHSGRVVDGRIEAV